MSTDTLEALAAARSALGQLIEAGKAVKAALDATIPDGEPVHPESRRLTWPISSGLLAIDAVDAALAIQPAHLVHECADNDSPWLVCKKCAAAGQCEKAAQPSAQGEAVAWKLVPVEPTEAMVDATHHGQPVADIYRDMLASAPAAPAQAVPLTEEQIDQIADDGHRNAVGGIYATAVYQFAAAIERAHGIAPKAAQEKT